MQRKFCKVTFEILEVHLEKPQQKSKKRQISKMTTFSRNVGNFKWLIFTIILAREIQKDKYFL